MATLEDKILGEKLEYYCSSDEGSDDDSSEEFADACDRVSELIPTPAPDAYDTSSTSNTGPKGVIKDWQRFKQLEVEKREEQERERQALVQKLSLTCRPESEDDSELADLMSNEILLEFAQKRMQELMKKTAPDKKFGSVFHLKTGEEYLHAIDQEKKEITIIVHIYEEYKKSCRLMNNCLKELCSMYPRVKFCKMLASTGGLSHQFKSEAIPALLVYKAGDLVGNYIQLEEELGMEFTSNDVSNFLLEKGVVLEYYV